MRKRKEQFTPIFFVYIEITISSTIECVMMIWMRQPMNERIRKRKLQKFIFQSITKQQTEIRWNKM